MSGLTVMVSLALPGPISTIFMPSPEEALSSFHMASAQARARSSGDSAAFTFTDGLPCALKHDVDRQKCQLLPDHALFRRDRNPPRSFRKWAWPGRSE